MFLKLLSLLGRKKVVLDRGISHKKFDEAKPWMNRYYILLRNRPKWFPFNILIHEMLADDHGEVLVLSAGPQSGLSQSRVANDGNAFRIDLDAGLFA